MEVRGVEPQRGFESFFDRLAVLDALPQAERLGEPAHVGGRPEVSVRAVGLQRGRFASGVDPFLERRASLSLGRVFAQPVIGARQLPRRVECARAAAGELARQIAAARRALERLTRSAYS